MKRRDFVKYTTLGTTAFMVPQFLKGFEMLAPLLTGAGSFAASGNRKILVVVQLSGGNDGLNTIIPYQDDLYYKARPKLAKAAADVLKLNDHLGFNPAMAKLKNIFDDGKMTVINNVGYPNPDRSHFRSMDIWHTASGSADYWHTGWVGRYLDATCAGTPKPYHALETDASLSLALKGEKNNGIALENPQAFYAIARGKYFKAIEESAAKAPDPHDDNLHYLYKTLAETGSSADYIYQAAQVYYSKKEYPKGEFGKNLKTIASLIGSGLDTSVYYISLSGFDTHDQQVNRQDKLLTELSEGLAVFTDDLKSINRMDDVVIMTFSEFGRRVGENASAGTDHGTANNMMIINGNLKKPGVLNEAPDLQDLDDGDLKYKVDFRQVYAEMLGPWLGADAGQILGAKFDALGLV